MFINYPHITLIIVFVSSESVCCECGELVVLLCCLVFAVGGCAVDVGAMTVLWKLEQRASLRYG